MPPGTGSRDKPPQSESAPPPNRGPPGGLAPATKPPQPRGAQTTPKSRVPPGTGSRQNLPSRESAPNHPKIAGACTRRKRPRATRTAPGLRRPSPQVQAAPRDPKRAQPTHNTANRRGCPVAPKGLEPAKESSATKAPKPPLTRGDCTRPEISKGATGATFAPRFAAKA